MGCEIEVKIQQDIDVEVNDTVVVEAGGTSDAIVVPEVNVDAEIFQWTLTSDNIYLTELTGTPPPWFVDMIDDVLNSEGVYEDIDDLQDGFSELEEGYTSLVAEYKVGDDEVLAKVEALYLTNDEYSAGYKEIIALLVNDYQSKATLDTVIGAWMNGGPGGAWFHENISVVSNVAYSAAKSASTLSATISGQQDIIDTINQDISDLENQLDGQIETLFYDNAGNNLGPNIGSTNQIDVTKEPYLTWNADGLKAAKTGDTYVLFETDTVDPDVKEYIASWRFGKAAAVNEPITDSEGYQWIQIVDLQSAQAYQAALEAQATADGKITTYYSPAPPPGTVDKPLGIGDLWYDSDDNNHLWWYDGAKWIDVRDVYLKASVDHLDEAFVDIDGVARAKSSLTVSTMVNGEEAVSGFLAESDGGATSSFTIFADKFRVADNVVNAQGGLAPFEIDTSGTTPKIKFNGLVSFGNIYDSPDFLEEDDFSGGKTFIQGDSIFTNTIRANRIRIDEAWVDGWIRSSSYSWDGNDATVGGSIPTGFGLFATGTEAGSYGYNIVGGSMYGGSIKGAVIEGGKIIGAEVLLRNQDGQLAYPVFTDKVGDTKYYLQGQNTYGYGDAAIIDFNLDKTFPYDAVSQSIYTRQNALIPSLSFDGFFSSAFHTYVLQRDIQDDTAYNGYIYIQAWAGNTLKYTSDSVYLTESHTVTYGFIESGICRIEYTLSSATNIGSSRNAVLQVRSVSGALEPTAAVSGDGFITIRLVVVNNLDEQGTPGALDGANGIAPNDPNLVDTYPTSMTAITMNQVIYAD